MYAIRSNECLHLTCICSCVIIDGFSSISFLPITIWRPQLNDGISASTILTSVPFTSTGLTDLIILLILIYDMVVTQRDMTAPTRKMLNITRPVQLVCTSCSMAAVVSAGESDMIAASIISIGVTVIVSAGISMFMKGRNMHRNVPVMKTTLFRRKNVVFLITSR